MTLFRSILLWHSLAFASPRTHSASFESFQDLFLPFWWCSHNLISFNFVPHFLSQIDWVRFFFAQPSTSNYRSISESKLNLVWSRSTHFWMKWFASIYLRRCCRFSLVQPRYSWAHSGNVSALGSIFQEILQCLAAHCLSLCSDCLLGGCSDQQGGFQFLFAPWYNHQFAFGNQTSLWPLSFRVLGL